MMPSRSSPGGVMSILLPSTDDAAVTGSSTYRPLPMLTLIATNAIFGLNPLAHHVVSLLFHLLSIFMLVSLTTARARWVICPLLIALFAIHLLWRNARLDQWSF